MTLSQSLIAELQVEAASTRKMLERFPIEHSDWKPHENSMSLGRVASHVAEIPGWIGITLETDELDLASRDFKPYVAASTEELLAFFDDHVNKAVIALQNALPEDFFKTWSLKHGEHVSFTLPKAVVLRSFAFNHLYHHRGQLSVYMRLLDVPVPGMYGPSYDDRVQTTAQAASN